MKPISLTGLLLLLSMTSCLNKYEKSLLGEYTLVSKQSVSKAQLPKLTLNSDKTFIIVDGNDSLKGKWEADDNGEWVYVDLFEDGNLFNNDIKIAEGRIFGGWDTIAWFNCYSDKVLKNYKNISFKK